MYEATFRIRGESAYATATEGTDATIELWCNDHCDLLYVDGSPRNELLDHIREQVGMKDVLSSEDSTLIVTGDCLKNHEQKHIETYLDRHDCLLLPPLNYTNGHKVCRVLALDSTNLTSFYQDVAADFEVTIDTKRDIETVPKDQSSILLDTELPSLSPRQREALTMAKEEGYYTIPREVTTEALADELGINRRTFEDHLRRAENKVIDRFVEFAYA